MSGFVVNRRFLGLIEMNFLNAVFFLIVTFSLGGCMTYPRFPSETSKSAKELMLDFGLDSRTRPIGPETLKGNTLRGEYKVFITDSDTVKLYFGEENIFYQEQGIVAYGIIPLPTAHAASRGRVQSYKYVDGVFLISAGCEEPEKLLVTTTPRAGEYDCWRGSVCQKSLLAGWERWSCFIERGNTLNLLSK